MTTALITGANKGVGLAVARVLGQRGFKIWLGARSEERGRLAEAQLLSEGINVEFVQLDVTVPISVATASRCIAASTPALDILVNNAGIQNDLKTGSLEGVPPSELPLTKVRELYDTNFFGAIAVTQTFLPLLHKSRAGRVVNVSSRFASFAHQTREDWPPRSVTVLGYATSKAALNMATVLFAYELRDTAIKINAVSPGTIATDLSGMKAEDLAGRPGFNSPEQGAIPIVKYATLPEDGPSGGFFGPDGQLAW